MGDNIALLNEVPILMQTGYTTGPTSGTTATYYVPYVAMFGVGPSGTITSAPAAYSGYESYQLPVSSGSQVLNFINPSITRIRIINDGPGDAEVALGQPLDASAFSNIIVRAGEVFEERLAANSVSYALYPSGTAASLRVYGSY